MSNLSEIMKKLYLERDVTGDVKFIVESELIPAHRCILATTSPKYKAQFYGVQPDTGDIHVEYVSAAAFTEFLQFFYLQEPNLTMENIGDVLNLSKQSLVDAFVIKCINFLKEELPVSKIRLAYWLANLYDIEDLKNHCDSEVSKRTMEFFDCEDFINFDRKQLIEILKLDSMNCKEIDIFEACIEWGKAACERDGLDPENMKELRTKLTDIIQQIRFCSMNIEDFVQIHKKYNGFFTADETNEIIYMIGKLKQFKSQRFNQTKRIQTKKFEGNRRSISRSTIRKVVAAYNQIHNLPNKKLIKQ